MKRREFVGFLGSGRLAACGEGAATGDAGGRVREWALARLRRVSGGRLSPGITRNGFIEDQNVALDEVPATLLARADEVIE